MGYLSQSDHEIVSSAVAEAELTTSGEIVTVLADRSDAYDDVVLVWAAALAFSAMSLFAVLPQPFMDLWDSLVGGWSHVWTTGELASMTIALGLVAFVAGWLLLSWDPLRFALTPGPVKTARAHARAIKHFKVGAERRTHGRTGVLLYLSMREHRAEIVASRSPKSSPPRSGARRWRTCWRRSNRAISPSASPRASATWARSCPSISPAPRMTRTNCPIA
jgi:putative membrane protein